MQSSGPAAVFVLPALLAMWQEVMGWNGLSISCGEAGLVGFEKATAIGKLFFSMPYGGYGGIEGVGDCGEVFAWLKSKKYLQENIVQFDSSRAVTFPEIYSATKLSTHIIELSQRAPYSENTTRNVGKAAEHKFSITKLDSSSEGVLIRLLDTHQKRTGEMRRLPQSCYKFLLARSGQSNSGIAVYGATNHEGLQCIHIYFATAGDAFYFDGFSTEAGLEQGANFFVLDTMIKRFREDGNARLNLGATPKFDKGLRRFKEGWGATDVAYTEYCRRSQVKRMVDFMTRLR